MPRYTESNKYSREVVTEIAQWVYHYYLRTKRCPGVGEVYRAFENELDNALSVAVVFDDKDFKHYVLSRGVPWIRVNTRLTQEQMYALSHVMDPTVPGGLRAKLRNLGIGYAKWTAWQKNPEFRQTFQTMSEDALQEHMPLIQQALIQTAEKGDMNAIKFAYEITGKWDPNSKAAIDVMNVLSRVVEIITKHVDNPITLAKIGSEVQMLAQSTLGVLPNNRVIQSTPVAAIDSGESVFSFEENYGKSDESVKVIQARE